MTLYRWLRRARIGLFVAVLLVVAMPAFAQEDGGADGPTPTLFLLPTQSVRDSVTSIVPERIGELLREQIGKDDRVTLMPPYEKLRADLGGASAAVAKAEQMYTSGIGLLTAGEDKKAADTFQRAVDIMEQNIADLSNFDVLADSLANLALAYFNAGFDLDARKRMQQHAHLRPEATLDPEKFPKELIEIYQSEAKKVKSAGPGKLEIKADGDALVFIDGVEKGPAPVTVDDVGFGYHYLVVRGASGSVWSEKIRVRGRNKKQTFEAELGASVATKAAEGDDEAALPPFYVDLLSEIESGEFGTDLGPYLKELAAQTGAAHTAWVVMYKEDGKYVAATFAYRASDGLIARGEDVLFNLELSNLLAGVSQLSNGLVELVLAMPEERAVTAVQLGEPPPEEVAVTEKPPGEEEPEVETESAYASGEPIQPPPETPPSKKGNTWAYVGATAGGIAVLGLVAGGLYLLSQNGDGSTAAGFNTEVTW